MQAINNAGQVVFHGIDIKTRMAHPALSGVLLCFTQVYVL
jgi:hypothetical protein